MSTILTVGAGQQYQTIAAAIAAANQIYGGVDIQVTAGTYVNDGGTITNNQVEIEGVGGVAKLVGAAPNASAALTAAGYNVSLENLDISGVTAGAGVLLRSGYLLLGNVTVHDNQKGVNSQNDPNSTLTIERSNIYHNGSATGGSNVDVGAIASLMVEYTQIHDAIGDAEIRSSARQTFIALSVIADNAGKATVSVDLPVGGQAVINGDTIEKGPGSTGTSMMAWNASGTADQNSYVEMNSNVLINDVFPNSDTLFNTSGVNLIGLYGSHTWNLPNLGTSISGTAVAYSALSTRPAIPSDTSIYVESIPSIAKVTGNRDGTVTVAGRFVAGHTVTLADTVRGHTALIGTATTQGNGWWSVTSQAKVDTTTVNAYTVSGVNDNYLAASMPGSLFLTDTGADHLTSDPKAADIFAIMSFKGSDVIDGFKTTSAAGAIHDILNFSGRGVTSFAQVQAMMSGSTSTILSLSAEKTITLTGVNPTTLSASDFVYS